ncbi:MAG: ThiF family adenylyltransferase [Pseudonocardia sp.]
MRTYRFTDGVLEQIEQRLAEVPPERGGALLAVGGLVHHFVEDTHGDYTAASWDISPALSAALAVVESAGHGVLAGTCHSHPSGVADPSGTDLVTTDTALRINSHLEELWIAVLTEGEPRPTDLAVGPGHRLSLHVLRRGPGDPRDRVVRVTPQVVPIVGELRACGVDVASATTVDDWMAEPAPSRLPVLVRVNGREKLLVRAGDDAEGGLLVDADHPAVPPAAVTVDAGQAVVACSPWDPSVPVRPQLRALVATARREAVAGATDRVEPLVGTLGWRHVLVAGLGSVGSRIAEDLVRAGVGRLTLIDPETVAAPNLTRTVYRAADIGEPKPAALHRALVAINPSVRTTQVDRPLGATDLAATFADETVDLVVAATDDLSEQATLVHHAYAAGVPTVACALYRAAAAGEVVLVSPSHATACWLCAIGQHGIAAAQRPDADYGLGGRLVGEIALGPAIHQVSDVATAAAIGLLVGPDRPAGAALKRLLTERRTLGIVATSPGWGFFATLFEGMRHQHAPQSVWVVATPRADCTVCGAERVPPLTTSQGADLRELLASLRTAGDATG